MSADYVLFLSLYLSGLIIRTAYELFSKRGPDEKTSLPLFLIVLAGMCMLWAGWFGMCPLDPIPLNLHAAVRWSGFCATIAGWCIAIVALLQLRGVENIDHLVTTGVYRRIRHPMYMGFILWFIGWATYHGAAASFLLGIPGIADVLYWRWKEGRALALRYGDVYQEYQKKTWF